MTTWLSLIISLPTENATLRQRIWRALRAAGAGVLRDGVYVLPERAGCAALLQQLAQQVNAGGGHAWQLQLQPASADEFIPLFDRQAEFAALLDEVLAVRRLLSATTAHDSQRQLRKLRKAFDSLVAIDFFPGSAHVQVEQALRELELACQRLLVPDEPQPQAGDIVALERAAFQGRLWATRRRPWVDRLASAWLIRRFIDPQARILWLSSPADCPPDALGFDFDGARFTHVGGLVSFEVLAASFALEQPSLRRLGLLVHFLDVGGLQPPEARGVEQVLAGLRATIDDDDQLLLAASAVFDALLASFDEERPPV